ncbi:MAG: ABC transporter substrate-binding protein [Nevskia sp.]|nr:ABC transporter substrate-binding protein [Nevskia sp.]
MRTAVFSLFFLLAAAAVLPAHAAGEADRPADGGPDKVVTAFHDALLNNMQHGKEYACAGRTKRMEPVVDASFDLPAIAQSTLRRHWSQLTAEQRQRFVAAFREQVILTYASQFDDFDGDAFTTLGMQPLGGGDQQLVHAKLQPGSGDLVKFDYVLRRKDGGWRIINVIADGVSDLAVRTSQYEKAFTEKGFEGLLAWLKDQTEKTRKACT